MMNWKGGHLNSIFCNLDLILNDSQYPSISNKC